MAALDGLILLVITFVFIAFIFFGFKMFLFWLLGGFMWFFTWLELLLNSDSITWQGTTIWTPVFTGLWNTADFGILMVIVGIVVMAMPAIAG